MDPEPRESPPPLIAHEPRMDHSAGHARPRRDAARVLARARMREFGGEAALVALATGACTVHGIVCLARLEVDTAGTLARALPPRDIDAWGGAALAALRRYVAGTPIAADAATIRRGGRRSTRAALATLAGELGGDVALRGAVAGGVAVGTMIAALADAGVTLSPYDIASAFATAAAARVDALPVPANASAALAAALARLGRTNQVPGIVSDGFIACAARAAALGWHAAAAAARAADAAAQFPGTGVAAAAAALYAAGAIGATASPGAPGAPGAPAALAAAASAAARLAAGPSAARGRPHAAMTFCVAARAGSRTDGLTPGARQILAAWLIAGLAPPTRESRTVNRIAIAVSGVSRLGIEGSSIADIAAAAHELLLNDSDDSGGVRAAFHEYAAAVITGVFAETNAADAAVGELAATLMADHDSM